MKRAVFLLLLALVAGAMAAEVIEESSEPRNDEVDATPEEEEMIQAIKDAGLPVSPSQNVPESPKLAHGLRGLRCAFSASPSTAGLRSDPHGPPPLTSQFSSFPSPLGSTDFPQVKFTIKRACGTCPRGAIATEYIPERYSAIVVPVEMGIRLPPMEPHGFASEYAHAMLQRIMRDPSFNETHGKFWATQPKPEDVLSPEMFTDDLLSMIHSPRVEYLIRYQRDFGRNVYYGNVTGKRYEPVHEMFPWVRFSQFAHLAAIIGTRDFAIHNETTDQAAYWLFPIADMFNHADEPNIARVENATHVAFYALRNITAGEELTYRYQPIIERNDMALFLYGFVQMRNSEVMCATDLPDYNGANPYKTPEDDDWYYGPEGRYNTFDELTRLESGLDYAEHLSTIEADEELLKGGKLKDWKEASVVAFRLGRKKALKKSIAAVKGELEKAAGVKPGGFDVLMGKKDEL
jgi:hypothetical protein